MARGVSSDRKEMIKEENLDIRKEERGLERAEIWGYIINYLHEISKSYLMIKIYNTF